MIAYNKLSHVHGNVIVRNYVIPIQIEKFITNDNGDRVYHSQRFFKMYMIYGTYILYIT